ncbi:MAG: alpha/beta hydrolase, partial [Phycisphaerae bacterium]|nr:alpha/beta hydrolase [Phycisphaerae bacterium]
PVVGELGKHFSVVRLDNRGIGQSKGHRPVTRLHDYSADLVELLDHLQVERAHVLGLSLGGVVAQRFTMDHGDRVDRLVLVSCPHRFGPYLREIAQLLGQSLRYFPRKLFARTMEILGSGPGFIDESPEKIDQNVAETVAQKISRAALVQQLKALGASDNDVEHGEFGIDHPTLVIGGEYDSLIPHRYTRQMSEVIPGSRFLLVEEAGHNPFMECPEKIVPAIISFLTGGEVSGGDPTDGGTRHEAAA